MRRVSGLALVVVSAAWTFAQEPAKRDTPKPLPAELVKAWEDAGGKLVWLRADEFGLMRSVNVTQPGDLPAFQFDECKGERVAKLPAPETPFGLGLSGPTVKDDAMKELARFKQLTSLHMYKVHVKDAGLKELVPLNKLTFLGLQTCAGVTDAGLKEVAKLEQLTSFELSAAGTRVKEAGLKELFALKHLTALSVDVLELSDEVVWSSPRIVDSGKVVYS